MINFLIVSNTLISSALLVIVFFKMRKIHIKQYYINDNISKK